MSINYTEVIGERSPDRLDEKIDKRLLMLGAFGQGFILSDVKLAVSETKTAIHYTALILGTFVDEPRDPPDPALACRSDDV